MTKYDKEVVDNAFAMFSEGIPVERIGREIGIAKQTIWRWAKKYDWKTRSKLIQEKALRHSDETLTGIKERQHKMIQLEYKAFLLQNKIELDILERVADGKDLTKKDKKNMAFLNSIIHKMNPPNLTGVQKQELHLVGEAEHSTDIRAVEEIKKLCNLTFKEQWREDQKKLK